MSLKLNNNAGDASVTLVDGGPVGSPSVQLDVRTLGKLTAPDGSVWVIEVSNAGVLTAVKQ